MKTRDRYLTGILLILIGILVGTILTLYQQGVWVNDHAQVKMTEVKKSSEPVYSDKELGKIDARFLFKKVAEKITPMVVYIETVIPLTRENMPDDEFHDRDNNLWDRFFQRKARTVGSGVIISGDGYILTNNHVIEGAVDDGIQVALNDKRVFKARIVGMDPTTDLAVLKIDAEDLSSIIIGNSDKVDVGEWVLAIGNPFRLRSTVTAGIVSALSRDVQIIDDQMRVESFIQTDAAINKGNSGGALVNTSGELIGINTAIASQNGSYQGYGFAVPSNLASKVARDIIEFGEVHRALLGVAIAGIDAYRARELGMNAIQGVEIMSVARGGAGAKGGLERQDVVLSVNGSTVNEANELQEKIAVLQPGDIAHLQIWRKGKVTDKDIKLEMLGNMKEELSADHRNPELNPEEKKRNFGNGIKFGTFDLGFNVMAFSRSEDEHEFDLIITKVKKGSEAERRGLKEGYIIKEVNNKKVEDLKTLKDLIQHYLRSDRSVLLHIETQEGAKGFYELNETDN